MSKKPPGNCIPMILFRCVLFLSITWCLFSSCQKEYSVEAGNSHGSLMTDGTGDCMPALVNGRYKKDTILKATNYVDIQVTITQTGSYFIKTDTVNGYSFSAGGTVSVAGVNTIRLLGSGKPLANGGDIFTVKYDSSVCSFNIIVTDTIIAATPAVFTVAGSPTACTGTTQTSNFFANVPVTASNTVTVNVNVTTAGTYIINAVTSPANGLSFSGSGILAVGSNQPITLIATGAPSTAGSIPYTITTTNPASNCGFNLTVQAASAAATFTFHCAAPIYTGTYQANTSTSGNTVIISVTSVAGGSYNITSIGTANNNGVTFIGTGVLTASPNPQSVTLFASGTPTAAGPFTYSLSSPGATGTCTIVRNFAITSPPSGFITANMDGVFTTFNMNIVVDTTAFFGSPSILVIGDNNATANAQPIGVGVAVPGGIVAGTPYSVNSSNASASCDYNDAANVYYVAMNDGTTQTNPFTITFTSITPSNVKGNFFGRIKAFSGSGATINITNGLFDVTF